MDAGRARGALFVTMIVLSSLTIVSMLPRPASATVTPWSDARGDVALPNADVVSGLAAVEDGIVYLRVTFADPPFPATATHTIDWCIDLDENPATGTVCGGINGYSLAGADAAVSLRSVPGDPFPQDFFLLVRQWPPTMLNATANLYVDSSTNTVCVFFPLSLLSGNGTFRYTVGSIFGGSNGANDAAPDAPGFGALAGFFSSQAGDPGPCAPPAQAGCPCPGNPPPANPPPANPPPSDPANPPAEPLAAGAPVQASWWIVPALAVSALVVAIGLARRRRAPPP